MDRTPAFLADIRAHPDDDAPRLIYADWLEETGGPTEAVRAEFIRLQCALDAGSVPFSEAQKRNSGCAGCRTRIRRNGSVPCANGSEPGPSSAASSPGSA